MMTQKDYYENGIDKIVKPTEFSLELNKTEVDIRLELHDPYKVIESTKAVASRISGEIAPTITDGDLPESLIDSQRRGMIKQMEHFSGDNLPEISKRAVALDLYSNEAYWNMAVLECFPIVFNAINAIHRDPDQYAGRMDKIEHKLDTGMMYLSDKINSTDNHVGTRDHTRIFSIAFDRDMPFSNEERVTLASHYIHHSRSMNRAALQFEKLAETLPPDMASDIEIVQNMRTQPYVLEAVSRLRSLSREEAFAAIKKEQVESFGRISDEIKDLMLPTNDEDRILERDALVPDKVKMKFTEKLIAGASAADPSTKSGRTALQAANRGLLDLYPLDVHNHPFVMASELVLEEANQRVRQSTHKASRQDKSTSAQL